MIFRQKVGNLRLILGEDLFFLEINVFFLEIKVKMALGSKTLDNPDVCATKNFCATKVNKNFCTPGTYIYNCKLLLLIGRVLNDFNSQNDYS